MLNQFERHRGRPRRSPLFFFHLIRGGLIALMILSILTAGGCSREKKTQPAQKPMSSQTPLVDVLKKHTADWMTIPGVVGAGEGVHEGSPCVLVFVERKTAQIDAAIPDTVDGYHVVIREVGNVQALNPPADR